MAITSPLEIPNLELWLDASDVSTLFQDSAKTTPVSSNGDPIGCFEDKSGNGQDFIQTNGTYKQEYDSASPINSLNTVFGDGGGYLSNTNNSNWTFMHDGSGFSILFVMRAYNEPPAYSAGIIGSGGQPGIEILHSKLFDNTLFVASSTSTDFALTASSNQQVYDLSAPALVQIDYEYGLTGDDCIFYNDGTAISGITIYGSLPGESTTAELELQLFNSGDLPTLGYQGNIGELIISRGIMSSYYRSSANRYLGDKWGFVTPDPEDPPVTVTGNILVDILDTHNGVYNGREYWLKGPIICGD